MIKIPGKGILRDEDFQFSAIRAQGPGGQNVNKVSTAIQLRFSIRNSNLFPEIKERLLEVQDQRLTGKGELLIKCQEFRSQEKNKERAIKRLVQWIIENTKVQKKRKATKPTRASQQRRQEQKSRRSEVKSSRGKVRF